MKKKCNLMNYFIYLWITSKPFFKKKVMPMEYFRAKKVKEPC